MKFCFSLHKNYIFCFRLINKALRTEDVYVLYDFRFYMVDLSQEIEKQCLQLRTKQQNVLKLYRYEILTDDEMKNFQNNIGNLVSINGYLSFYSQRSLVYDLARKRSKTDCVQRALFENDIDLDVIRNISIVDVREYSIYAEQADSLVDIGKTKMCF